MLGDIDDSGRNLDPDRAPSSHPGALCDGVDEDPESCGRVRSQSELLGISNEVEHSAKYDSARQVARFSATRFRRYSFEL